MKILVVGGGGREHALVWKLAAEAGVTGVVCAPGNPGIAGLAGCVPADLTSPDDLLAVAEREAVDLTVVGPEVPLSHGRRRRVRRQAAWRLSGPPARPPRSNGARCSRSASWRVTACRPRGVSCARRPDDARAAVARGDLGFPLVLKADGLAAGKGVVIADDRAAADAAIHEMMVDRRFGAAGDRLLLEEFLVGQEASYFVLADGDARSSPSRRRRITSASSTTIAARTPAAWARLRRARSSRPRSSSGCSTRSSAPCWPAWRRRDAPIAGFCTWGSCSPPMVRASSSSTSASAIRKRRSCCRCSTDDLVAAAARGGVGRARRARHALRPAAARRGRAGRRRLPGRAEDRHAHSRPRRGRRRSRRARLPRRHEARGARRGRRRRPRADGRGARARRTRTPIAVAYEAAGRITFDGMHMRRDIGAKAVAVLQK